MSKNNNKIYSQKSQISNKVSKSFCKDEYEMTSISKDANFKYKNTKKLLNVLLLVKDFDNINAMHGSDQNIHNSSLSE